MKFIISRASQWRNEQPCEEAKEEESIYGDRILKHWVMEFNSLEEIINFKSKYGDIVIRDSWFFGGIQEIIIYDDYLE